MTFQEEEYWGKKRIKGDLWTNPTGGRQEGKNGKYDRRFREIVQWNSNTYTTWGVNSMRIVHYSQSLASQWVQLLYQHHGSILPCPGLSSQSHNRYLTLTRPIKGLLQ